MKRETPKYSPIARQDVFRISDGDGNPIAEAITDVRHGVRWVSNVWVKDGHRGNGLGRQVLTAVTAAYPHETLYLLVRAYDGGIVPDEDLIVFYESAGFTRAAVPGILHRIAIVCHV
ncbi:GNAT family N-acetyltransferase [Hymenobacter algoricola]|uniref:N-acetyltransferase domain-containing protein n=1 Tax=Hymenobacter algoricola TaxID=486267 RepID=A0ABP7N9H0_9BACT